MSGDQYQTKQPEDHLEMKRTDSLCSPDPQVQLLNCVRDNRLEDIPELLDDGADINHLYGHPYNKTILEIACSNFQNPEMIMALLKFGADPNHFNKHHKKQALHFAVETGNDEVLNTLLKSGKVNDINALSKGNTALNVLIKSIKTLNKNERDFVECARLLLANGIDVNKPDSRDQTPVYLAAKNKYTNLLELILKRGKSIDLDRYHDDDSYTARDLIKDGNLFVGQLPANIDQNKNTAELLFGYLKTENENHFTELEINEQLANSNNGSDTVLQLACKKGLPKAVWHLLNNGANPNLTIPQNETRPIEIACKNGYYEILQHLLDFISTEVPEDIFIVLLKRIDSPQDEKRNHKKCFQILLSKKTVNVNQTDKKNNTALHYAARYAGQELTLELLRNRASLACRNDFDILPVADVSAETLQIHFDECLQPDSHQTLDDNNFKINFNYTSLLPPQNLHYHQNNIVIDIDEDGTKTPFITTGDCNNEGLQPETGVLLYMSQSPELKHLLKHPLITSFLFLKWHRIRWFFYVNLAFYITFCISLILYILLLYGQIPSKPTTFTNFLFALVSVTFVLLVLRECFQLIVFSYKYFINFENWLEVSLITITGIILFNHSADEDLRKQLSAIAILIAAAELVLLVGQHPRLSTNIVMLRTVSYNFFKFLLWYSILIFAFALSFYTLFKETSPQAPKNDTKDEDEPDFFIDPGISVFKTIVMLTGEFDASSIHFQSFPITSHIIFIMFVFMITIVLVNLLNGLAVSDTQSIQQDAELVGHITRIQHIAYIESMLLGNLIPDNIKQLMKLCCCIPNEWVTTKVYISPLARRVCLFPTYLKNGKMEILANQDGKVVLPNVFESNDCIGNCKILKLDHSITKAARLLVQQRKLKAEREGAVIAQQELITQQRLNISQQNDIIAQQQELINELKSIIYALKNVDGAQ